MKLEKVNTRQHIINTGYQLISVKGFTGVGLAEILKNADVPKGSFYHYFKSKELFGEAIIEDYFEQYFKQLAIIFNVNSKQTAQQQLMQYWRTWLGNDLDSSEQNRCLVVKLSAEVADLSDSMRIALRNGSMQVIAKIAGCIEKGIKDKSICSQNADDSANMLYTMWLGASLLSKLQQDKTLLTQTLTQTEKLLKTGKVN